MKILIVEDEPALRELIQRSLEKERYVVEVAADFNSALRKIEDYDYDCVLLDIMLPDGSGLDLLEKLKAMHKRENVIIILFPIQFHLPVIDKYLILIRKNTDIS